MKQGNQGKAMSMAEEKTVKVKGKIDSHSAEEVTCYRPRESHIFLEKMTKARTEKGEKKN